MSCKIPLVRLAAVLILAPSLAFSATAAGKVRSALGTVDRMKAKQKDWTALRVGANIFQSDRVRTGVESEVIFGLTDGSSITIAENAEVEIAQLLEPNGKGGFETRIDINKGHLNFAVHKLQDKNSQFIFKTGSAKASIRGTEGFVGGEGVFFAGLKTGRLEITPEGKESPVSIVAGETTFGTDSLVVLKLASSGDGRFAKQLEKILAEKKPLDELVADVVQADSVYQETLKAEAENAAAAVPMNSFTVSSESPVEICEQGLVVEGFYRTMDETATLVLNIAGKYQSDNLIRVADGNVHSFAHKVVLNDENGLWSANKAKMTLSGKGVNESKTIDLRVNKACLEVNTKVPTLSIPSYDSLRCMANLSVGDMQGDVGILSVYSDGSQISEDAIVRNVQQRVKLKNGIHEYVFKMEDQAGNKAELERTMGCYPAKRFNVDLVGAAREKLTVPPGNPDQLQMNEGIVKTLQFKIRTPENDPSHLYKVVVKMNGKVILQEVLSQIQNLDYQVPLELNRGVSYTVDIEVTHKSGYKAKVKKIYEVSK
ncbi:MAG: FecR domain-containing protein [Fibrobacter sp.]|nr:FecR domain-containing protein [Fibrobacter sp.]